MMVLVIALVLRWPMTTEMSRSVMTVTTVGTVISSSGPLSAPLGAISTSSQLNSPAGVIGPTLNTSNVNPITQNHVGLHSPLIVHFHLPILLRIL